MGMIETREKVTAYVTKWWQTKGILRVEAEVWKSDCGSEYLSIKARGYSQMVCPADWHRDYKAACDRVAELAKKKVKSLHAAEAKISKLRNGAEAYDLTVEVLETTGSSK